MSTGYVPGMRGMHLHHSDRFDGERLFHVIDAAAGADRWAASAGAAQQRFTDGVQNTQVDVVARATAQQGVLLQNFTQAITSGRWARRLAEVGTAGWKQKTTAKASNYGTGVAAGKPNYLAAAQKLYPYIGQGQSQVASMPKGTIADSKARALFWIDYMAAYKAAA